MPTLTDGVVTLRAHRDDDVAGCLEQCLDPLSQQWTTVPVPYALDDARRFVRDVMPGGWASDQEWGFAVEADGAYAGTVSLRNEGEGRAELAYGSHPRVRGTGVMERALRLLVDWGFSPASSGGRELQTIIWWANKGNWASRKLAWRLGFSFGGTVRRWLPQRGELLDAWVGGLVRDDPRRPRGSWLEAPRISGSRVVLRGHRDEDAQRVQEACSDERTAYWLGALPSPYTLEHAHEFLHGRTEAMATGRAVHWMIADPDPDSDTDVALGLVSLMDLEDGQAEIGFWAHPDARGRGVMTEAVRLVARHAFIDVEDGGLGLDRVHLQAAVDNSASRHVAEANGFTQTGVQRLATTCRDGKHDLVVYDLLATDLASAAG